MKILPSLCSRATRLVALGVTLATIPTGVVRADAVFAWNEALLHVTSVPSATRPLLLDARALAMMHLAVASAVDAVADPDVVRSRDGRRAATVAAARDVLVALLPERTTLFERLAERHLSAIPEGEARVRGLAAGADAAARVLRWRADDGWVQSAFAIPLPVAEAERADEASDPAVAVPSPWRSLRPFALAKADQFPVAEVRVVRSNGEIFADPSVIDSRLFEGVDRQAAVAARETVWAQSPLVAWNRVARQAAAERMTDLPAQARLLAALNMALADAILAARQAQHEVGSWRSVITEVWLPVDERLALSTDLIARVDDGLRQEAVRLEYGRVLVPPVRNYPAVTATVAGAAQAVLARQLPGAPSSVTLPAASGARIYPDAAAAAREQAFLCSLDGAHSREACVAGYRLGAEVGRWASRPLPRLQR